ncbi:MAG TPA: TetR family transcriptional regulator [Acidimicrobiales bacterium]|nr:TetR family transcriptional regulator [Acidimicrobiales bacterium]
MVKATRAVNEDEDPRASDGRIPGRRGLATRQRLLDRTESLLDTMSFRDIKVIDIAREAKTSPATFYQYFPDIESAVLALAEATNLDTSELGELVRHADWRGKKGYANALHLADAFIEFWERHRATIRVTDLLVAEGDMRFQAIRTRLLNDLALAMAEVMKQTSAGAKATSHRRLATAGVLVAMMANVTTHRYTYEFWGIQTADLRASMADIIFTSLTGKLPPAS